MKNNNRNKAVKVKESIIGKIEPNINIKTLSDSKLNRVLLNLKASKGATDEQLQEIAKCYGFDYNANVNKTSPYNVLETKEFER